MILQAALSCFRTLALMARGYTTWGSGPNSGDFLSFLFLSYKTVTFISRVLCSNVNMQGGAEIAAGSMPGERQRGNQLVQTARPLRPRLGGAGADS